MAVQAPPPGGPGVDLWQVVAREDGHVEATVRLFLGTPEETLVRYVRLWPGPNATGPALLYNTRTGEVVY